MSYINVTDTFCVTNILNQDEQACINNFDVALQTKFSSPNVNFVNSFVGLSIPAFILRQAHVDADLPFAEAIQTINSSS